MNRTGMKCLPASKLSQAQGNVLHDWHAEVLCIRAFNRFVLDECHALASGSKTLSDFIHRRGSLGLASTPETEKRGHEKGLWDSHPFAWRDDVILHMYCSEAPCGDASMELTIAAQEDASPWPTPDFQNSPSTTSHPDPQSLMPGRAYFSHLGIVRRKPSRGDAPPTLSKSCSDKLSLHQCTSLLSSLTSLLVSPEHAYLSTLVLPETQYSPIGCMRAFGVTKAGAEGGSEETGGRMAPLRGRVWGAGYTFRPFVVKPTTLEFRFSRRSHIASTPICSDLPTSSSSFGPTSSSPLIESPSNQPRFTPSNLSIAFTHSGKIESTLSGVLQGRKASSASITGASFTSRRKMWGLTAEIINLLHSSPNIDNHFARSAGSEFQKDECENCDEGKEEQVWTPTYGEMKNSISLNARRRVKQDARTLPLNVWIRNSGDDDWIL
ncbi:adenosine deaminase/editase [Xylariaceae sp. FL1019]|nr:adenosine deaminase/editase [Xylariaceae sp. FL1019]